MYNRFLEISPNIFFGTPCHIDWPIYLSANFFVLSPQNGVLKPAERRLFPFLSRPAKPAGQHIDRPDAVCIRAAFFSGAIRLPRNRRGRQGMPAADVALSSGRHICYTTKVSDRNSGTVQFGRKAAPAALRFPGMCKAFPGSPAAAAFCGPAGGPVSCCPEQQVFWESAQS